MNYLNVVEISVRDLSAGDVVACDVYNRFGTRLVKNRTVLNPFIIESIRSCGIESVTVYYPPLYANVKDYNLSKFVGDYRESVLLVKDMVQKLSAGGTFDYAYVDDISQIIYSTLEGEGNLTRCIHEISGHDSYTYSHIINVAFYSMLIAKWLNLPEEGIKKALQSGFLHDVGKCRVPLEILNKKEPLTTDEMTAIKRHPVYGYFILQDNRHIDFDVKRAVLLHHERVNKSGYPFNAADSSISMYTRIVSVADVYDAMTSNRVYKRKACPFKAFRMFLTEGTTQFDRYISKVFLSNITTQLIGSSVQLTTGVRGTIVYIPPDNILSAVVQVGTEYVQTSEESSIRVESFI